jgi:hypothetical protein
MIDFIIDNVEYEIEKRQFKRLFKEDVSFPVNIFQESFLYFNAFEFDLFYEKPFFIGLRRFLIDIGIKKFTFFTVLPSAEEYFFKHFLKYSSAVISTENEYADYFNFLELDPGGSPADALYFNSETIAIFSSNDEWAIIGSKDWELGIIGFKNKIAEKKFLMHFVGCNSFTTIKKRVYDLDKILNFESHVREKYMEIINNYQ